MVVDWNDLEPLDKWAYLRTVELLREVQSAYEAYKFHQVYRAVYEYIVNDLSAIYMDATKDRLYSEAADSPRRRAVQSVLMNVLEVLVRIMAPILSFTTDEVWELYPPKIRDRADRPESVQLAGWPHVADFVPKMPDEGTDAIMDDFAVLLEMREAVTKALEDARGEGIIKKSQEAYVEAVVDADTYEVLKRYPAEVLVEMLIISGINFTQGDEVSVAVMHTTLEMCERCWNYKELDAQGGHADLCVRCSNVVDAL